ncbi:MAG: hypothetical protein P1U40_10830 [Coxiellaceae bacterium]|nr:hypothetical protein [Coxiellaceae bacterium]
MQALFKELSNQLYGATQITNVFNDHKANNIKTMDSHQIREAITGNRKFADFETITIID